MYRKHLTLRRGFVSAALVATILSGLPPASSSAQSAGAPVTASSEFVVRPGDVLKVRVWPNEELGGEYPVEEDGRVWLPELGAVQAGGMTVAALRAELRRQYGEALRAPAVSVTPVFNVGVLGSVQRPGLYPVEPTQTIFDAISLAGGFRDNARTDRIRLVREGEVVELNARETLEAGGGDLSLMLRSGDRIVVPEGRRWRMLDIFYAAQSVLVLVTLIGRL